MDVAQWVILGIKAIIWLGAHTKIGKPSTVSGWIKDRKGKVSSTKWDKKPSIKELGEWIEAFKADPQAAIDDITRYGDAQEISEWVGSDDGTEHWFSACDAGEGEIKDLMEFFEPLWDLIKGWF